MAPRFDFYLIFCSVVALVITPSHPSPPAQDNHIRGPRCDASPWGGGGILLWDVQRVLGVVRTLGCGCPTLCPAHTLWRQHQRLKSWLG
eukprot:2310114-Amphidinium_carterae.3